LKNIFNLTVNNQQSTRSTELAQFYSLHFKLLYLISHEE